MLLERVGPGGVRGRYLDPEWVEATVTKLENMVREGDESSLAEKTVEVVSERVKNASELPLDA